MLKNRKENKVMIKGVPANINELKTKANNKSSWRERLSAVNVLKEYDCVQSKDILARLAINDPVFKVKEKAFRAAQALGVTSHGKPIYLGKSKKGNLVKGINLDCIIKVTTQKMSPLANPSSSSEQASF